MESKEAETKETVQSKKKRPTLSEEDKRARKEASMRERAATATATASSSSQTAEPKRESKRLQGKSEPEDEICIKMNTLAAQYFQEETKITLLKDDKLTEIRGDLDFSPTYNKTLAVLEKNNYRITLPVFNNLRDRCSDPVPFQKNLHEEIEKNHKNTLELITAERIFKKFTADQQEEIQRYPQNLILITDKYIYWKVFDNFAEENNERNGFTEYGEKYNKPFKKENKNYIETNRKQIVNLYDRLEDLQFNYEYWQNICEESKTSIKLFTGATTAFKALGENKNSFFSNNLLLDYVNNRSVNIFISCENICLATELNRQTYTVSDQIGYNNLPCIGFDDLVITYNSNIVFCRSLIRSVFKEPFEENYPNRSAEKLALLWPDIEEDERAEAERNTVNKNFKNCKKLSKIINNFNENYEYYNSDALEAAMNSGDQKEVERIGETIFFNSTFIKRGIIDRLTEVNRLNANLFRINYKNNFLKSTSCNECSKEKLIEVIKNTLGDRKSISVFFDSGTYTKTKRVSVANTERKKLPNVKINKCTWCGDEQCSKNTDKEHILYELGINYKIFVELLLNKLEANNEERNMFYEQLNRIGIEQIFKKPLYFIERTQKRIAPDIASEQLYDQLIREYEIYANTSQEVMKYDKIMIEYIQKKAEEEAAEEEEAEEEEADEEEPEETDKDIARETWIQKRKREETRKRRDIAKQYQKKNSTFKKSNKEDFAGLKKTKAVPQRKTKRKQKRSKKRTTQKK